MFGSSTPRSSAGLTVHALGVQAVALDDRVQGALYLKISLPAVGDGKSRWPLFNGPSPHLISTPIFQSLPLPTASTSTSTLDNHLHTAQTLLELSTSNYSSSSSSSKEYLKPHLQVSPTGNITISSPNTSAEKRRISTSAADSQGRLQWLLVLEFEVELAVDDTEQVWMTTIPLPACLNNKIRFRPQGDDTREAEIQAHPKIYPSNPISTAQARGQSADVEDVEGWLQGTFQSTTSLRLQWSYSPSEISFIETGDEPQESSFATLRPTSPSPANGPTYLPTPPTSSSGRLTGLRNQPPPLPMDTTMEEYSFEVNGLGGMEEEESPAWRLPTTPSPVHGGQGMRTPSGKSRIGTGTPVQSGQRSRSSTPTHKSISHPDKTPSKSITKPSQNITETLPTSPITTNQSSQSPTDKSPQPSPEPKPKPSRPSRLLLPWTSLLSLTFLLLLLSAGQQIQKMKYDQYALVMEVRDLRIILDGVLAGRGDAHEYGTSKTAWQKDLSDDHDVVDQLNKIGMEGDGKVWEFEGQRKEGYRLGEEGSKNAVGRVVFKNPVWTEWLNHPSLKTLAGGLEWAWKVFRFALLG